MKKLLFPATYVIDHLGMKNIFLLILTTCLIPLGILSYIALGYVNRDLLAEHHEQEGLEVIIATTQLLINIDEIQEIRLSPTTRDSDDTRILVKQKQEALLNQLSHLEQKIAASPDLSLTADKIKQISSTWKSSEKLRSQQSTHEILNSHGQIIKHVLNYINLVAHSSELFAEPDSQTSYLIDALVRRIPALLGYLGQARHIGNEALSNPQLRPDVRNDLLLLISHIEHQLTKLETEIPPILDQVSEIKGTFIKDAELIHKFIDTTHQHLLSPSEQHIPTEHYSSMGTKAVDITHQLFKEISPIIQHNLDKKIEHNQNTKNAILTLITASICMLIYLLVSVYAGFIKALRRIKNSAEHLAAGDLTYEIEIKGGQEMQQIGEAMRNISEGIARTVASIINTSQIYTDVSQRLSLSSQLTENSVSSQVRDSHATSKSISELSMMVKDISDNISNAADAAQQADQTTRQGHQVVSAMIESIDTLATDIEKTSHVISKLSEDSQKIGGILKLIREIADQTNLLALNAAIEAARAGEQGRGFAVVADEVRSLAQKTHSATEDIQKMVENLSLGSDRAVDVMKTSEKQLAHSVDQAKRTNDALTEITELVSSISEMNSRIAISAEQQSDMAKVLDNNVINMTTAASQASAVARSNVEDSSIIKALASEALSLINRFLIDQEKTQKLENDPAYILFKWDDSFSVGIPEIDRQHKILVGMVNEVNQHIKLNRNMLFIHRVFQGLIDYTVSHFAYEEDLLERYTYPDLEAHKEKHKKLVAQILEFQNRLNKEEENAVCDLLEFLNSWLVHHIKGADKEYGLEIRSKGAGRQEEAATSTNDSTPSNIENDIELF